MTPASPNEDVIDLLCGEDEGDFAEDFFIDFLANGDD